MTVLATHKITEEAEPVLTPMLLQYQEQKKAHPDCLLFFRLGDFYELFFEDAITASKVLQITLTQRGKSEGKPIPMCGVPFHAYEHYVKKLLQGGFRVALCEQTETPDMQKKSGRKGPLSREVVRIITPSMVVEDSFLESSSHSFLFAASPVLERKISCALFDLASSEFFVEEISPDHFLSFLEQYQPSEILIPDMLYAQSIDRLRLLESRVTPLAEVRFNLQNSKENLLKTYALGTLSSLGDFSNTDILALSQVLDYVALTQKKNKQALPFPKKKREGSHLLIDSATRRNLEIHHSVRGEKEGSLFHVIDRTITNSGARLLSQTLSSPLLDRQRLEKRLNRIAFFCSFPSVRDQCREALKASGDIIRSATRIALKKGGPRDFIAIRQGLFSAESLSHILKKDAHPFVIPPLLRELKNELSLAMSESCPLLARDGGFIREGYDEKLDAIRAFEKNGAVHLEILQESLKSATGISTLKIKFNGILGYFLECSPSQKEKILPTFIPRQELSGALRYTTPELQDLASKILSAKEKALARELELFELLTDKITAHHENLLAVGRFLAQIDLSSSMALLSQEKGYTRPEFHQGHELLIEKGRHPTLDSKTFEANTAAFEKDTSFFFLTGPNMAGKSTYLRQVALITLMAQCGFYVPAERVRISIVDRIFSRIGAGDDLAAGLSTFMVEMVETATILNQATKHSLVILDELGRGTSTYDGLSLAWAVSEKLVERGCKTLFATHYFELTDLAQKMPSIKNLRMAVKEHEGQILFLHKVEVGCASRSYGLHVAALAGVPRDVIQRAETLLMTFSEKNSQDKSSAQLALNLAVVPNSSKEESKKLLEQDALIQKLKALDLNTLTPLEALNILAEFKKKVA